MLVLTRKLQEKIQIGNDITITILRMKGNTVRVGIEAPRDVRVVRAELPRFEDASPDGTTQTVDSTQNAELTQAAESEGEFEFEMSSVSSEAEAEPDAAEQVPAGKTPSVGRRFIIRQKVGRFGRPQNTAVAAT